MRPCIPVPCLQTEWGRACKEWSKWERAREMPHVDLVLFPSNIHKQEQTNVAAQSNCNFLFKLILDFQDMLTSLCLNLMTQCLIIIWLFTSATPFGFIKEEGKSVRSCSEVHKRRAHAHKPLHSCLLGLWAGLWRRSTSQCFPLCVCPYRLWKN